MVAVAQPEANEAYYYIAGVDGEGVVSHADAVAGGCLSEDGHVAVLQLKRGGKVDSARHVEHDSALARFLARPAQGALAAVVGKGGDVIDGSAATAAGVTAEAFRAGEGGSVVKLCRRAHGSGGCQQGEE